MQNLFVFSQHPLYDNRNLHNDIAILKLDDYLRPSTTIQFACLMDSISDINTTGIVVGFGDTIPGANKGNCGVDCNMKLYEFDLRFEYSSTS
jgi:hypothetical protein